MPYPIVVPTVSPVTLPMTCRDDYFNDRTNDFNIINPSAVFKNLDHCNNPNTQWLMIGDRQLSPYFQKTLRLQNVYLSNGCLIQSIIVPRQAPIQVLWDPNSYKATVTIPCIVPRIVIGYDYTFNTGTENVRGSAIIGVKDVPSEVKVEIKINSNRICTILNDHILDVESQSEISLTLDREMQQVQYVIERFLKSNVWINFVYEQEIRAFTIRVINEAFSQSSQIFPPLVDLKKSCDVIT